MSRSTSSALEPQKEQSPTFEPRLPALGAPGFLDHLVHPLVADVQRVGDLAQRGPGQVQPTHRVVVVGLGEFGTILRLGPRVGGGASVPQQVSVNRHLSTVPRHVAFV